MSFLLRTFLFLFCFRSGRRILAFIVTISLLTFLFYHFEPQRFNMSPIQKRVGNELVEKAVEKFPWNREVGSVMMIEGEEAWSPFFQEQIRAKVANFNHNGSRKFDILPDKFTERVIKTLGFKSKPDKLSDSSINKIVEKMDADTLLVIRFSSKDYIEDEKTASGHLSCTFFSKMQPEPLSINVSVEHKKASGPFTSLVHYFRIMPMPHRLIWGILGVLLFPFLMTPLTLTVVHAQSAKANGLMVFVYALVIFIFEGLLFFPPKGIFHALLMCAWGIIIVWYILKTSDLLASPGFRQRMQSHN
ncbi:MAG: hypothetical protein IJS08_17295 [Victivallales bacterium]|nr:hypothetical protein [Victivallales bacterium]